MFKAMHKPSGDEIVIFDVDQIVSTPPGASLHYLDADREALITFHDLQVYHRPQLYTGYRYENPLHQVHREPDTGGFIHLGEEETRMRSRHAILTSAREQQKTEQRINQKMSELFGTIEAQPAQSPGPGKASLVQPAGEGEAGLPKCVFCVQVTDDCWYLNRSDNTCKCRNCYRQGQY